MGLAPQLSANHREAGVRSPGAAADCRTRIQSIDLCSCALTCPLIGSGVELWLIGSRSWCVLERHGASGWMWL